MCVCGAYESLPCPYGDPKTCPNNTTVPAELQRISDMQKKQKEAEKKPEEKKEDKGGKGGKK